MAITFIALGSNLGDRQNNLEKAIEAIATMGTLLKKSVIVESRALTTDNSAQPDYLNRVVQLETILSPQQLLARLLAIEASLGRHREVNTRWKSRTIDLDILFYDDLILQSDDLEIPHCEFTNRPFVLQPMVDIAPEWVDPRSGQTISALWDHLRQTSVTADRDCVPFQIR